MFILFLIGIDKEFMFYFIQLYSYCDSYLSLRWYFVRNFRICVFVPSYWLSQSFRNAFARFLFDICSYAPFFYINRIFTIFLILSKFNTSTKIIIPLTKCLSLLQPDPYFSILPTKKEIIYSMHLHIFSLFSADTPLLLSVFNKLFKNNALTLGDSLWLYFLYFYNNFSTSYLFID